MKKTLLDTILICIKNKILINVWFNNCSKFCIEFMSVKITGWQNFQKRDCPLVNNHICMSVCLCMPFFYTFLNICLF